MNLQREYEEEIAAKPYGIIYKTTNTVNGKVYIGQTTQGLTVRKGHHIRDYDKPDRSHTALYRAFLKYGLDSFTWEEIDIAANDTELNTKEVYWIKHYEANKGKGYNMTAGGQGVKNYKVTEEGVQRRKDVLNRMWANGHKDKIQNGESHSRTVLKETEVREIVKLLIKRELHPNEIANKYGVRRHIIDSIKHRHSWKYVVTEEDYRKMNERLPDENKKVKEIIERDVLEMKDLLLYTSIPSLEIYSMYNITHGQFNTILYNSKFSYLFTEEEAKKTRNRRDRKELSIKEVIKIKELLQEDLYSYEEIAMILDISKKAVGDISRGRIWTNILIDLPMEDIDDYDWKPIELKPRKPNRKNQN